MDQRRKKLQSDLQFVGCRYTDEKSLNPSPLEDYADLSVAKTLES